jgi:hypothetical protein
VFWRRERGRTDCLLQRVEGYKIECEELQESSASHVETAVVTWRPIFKPENISSE